MKKIYYTYFSLLILFLTIFLFAFAPEFILLFHFIIPLLLVLIGLISALFGSKGEIRMVVVVLHLFILIVFASIYILGIYGFNEP